MKNSKKWTFIYPDGSKEYPKFIGSKAKGLYKLKDSRFDWVEITFEFEKIDVDKKTIKLKPVSVVGTFEDGYKFDRYGMKTIFGKEKLELEQVIPQITRWTKNEQSSVS